MTLDGENMDGLFCPLPKGVRRRLFDVCLAHPLFCDLYEPFSARVEETGLAPEEVWSEALRIAARLGKSPRPDFSIKRDYEELSERYRTFISPEGVKTNRSEREAESSRCASLTVLLYMLASFDSNERNPYQKTCIFLVRRLMEHPLYTALCRDIRRCEADEETEGHFVPPTDYTRLSEPDFLNAGDAGGRMNISELVDETVASCSASVCASVMHVLIGYNKKHGHCAEAHIDRLHDEINRLTKERNAPRTIENNGTCILNNQGPVNGDVKEQHNILPSPDVAEKRKMIV